MTTERRRLLGRWSLGSCLLIVLLSCASWVGTKGGLNGDELAKLPSNMDDAYVVFAHRCSRCHSLARAFFAQIDDMEHWRRYVGRMRRQPGSGITEADAERILMFLEYHTEARLRAGGTVESSTTGRGRPK